MAPSIAHLLNRTLTVMREQATDDGMGGTSLHYTSAGSVKARVSRSTGQEVVTAEQEGAVILEDIYLDPNDTISATVRRNDFLVDGSDRWEVVSTVMPSDAVYLKAQCRRDVPAWPLP